MEREECTNDRRSEDEIILISSGKIRMVGKIRVAQIESQKRSRRKIQFFCTASEQNSSPPFAMVSHQYPSD